ncbi:hypothetical protein B7P43_G14828 [Cryptotermes secundus]|uniref:Direct IAP-binding protein with low pI n=1 Tax=Cryptotermes secundus TaxID=105785 RepID=A0A2J7RM60_9NEOP|nr:uncharacterized protein LOC111870325 [Cryptotermes secundus]PNF41925.1 hypothetical protein B7P43_G14828 [Cryptotermes secundus]
MVLWTRFLFRTLTGNKCMSFSFQPKIPLNFHKFTFQRPSNNCRRSVLHCVKASLFFSVAHCTSPLEENDKLIEAPSPQKLTSEYLISQASTSTVSATQQLLTLTLAAISDTAKMYRKCMEQLMCTMDECLLTQGPEAASLELWDEVVAMRVKVEDCKQRLQELTSFMEYVDKLATAAAETAFLGGAEHMSTVMCESLNSAHAKLAAEYDKTRAKEIELLKQQENFIRRSCGIGKELKKKTGVCEGT